MTSDLWFIETIFQLFAIFVLSYLAYRLGKQQKEVHRLLEDLENNAAQKRNKIKQ